MFFDTLFFFLPAPPNSLLVKVPERRAIPASSTAPPRGHDGPLRLRFIQRMVPVSGVSVRLLRAPLPPTLLMAVSPNAGSRIFLSKSSCRAEKI